MATNKTKTELKNMAEEIIAVIENHMDNFKEGMQDENLEKFMLISSLEDAVALLTIIILDKKYHPKKK